MEQIYKCSVMANIIQKEKEKEILVYDSKTTNLFYFKDCSSILLLKYYFILALGSKL